MQRMIRTHLTFAGEVKPTEQIATPIKAVAVCQRAGIKVPQRQMKCSQVVGGIDHSTRRRAGKRMNNTTAAHNNSYGHISLRLWPSLLAPIAR